MKRFSLLLVLCVLPMLPASQSGAQNVTGYGMMPEPTLFLLREPAVHDELKLSADQRRQLAKVNQSFDAVLLASRNLRAEDGQKKVNTVLSETRKQVSALLDAQQRTRLRQITYRLRGLPFVLAPQAARELQLSSQQKSKIESIVKETAEEVQELQGKTFEGQEAQRKRQQAVTSARKKEQQRILAALDDSQKQRMLALVGRAFDAKRLGRVSFKAPELATGDPWLNSPPLQLADLRGKVIALHFWAFG